MILHSAFPVDPWQIREIRLDHDLLAQSESLFALGNGHIGLRGNLDEGEPHGIPGTYLNGFYELRPLPYAESAYGNPESSQSIVNVTNGKLIRLLVDDEPFDVRYGTLVSHERTLDLRAGTLTRRVVWISPAGKQIRVTSTRLVSFTQRSVAAIQFEVEAVEDPIRVVLQSELVANETVPAQSADPREAAAMERPLEAVDQSITEHGMVLVHRTRSSNLRVAAGMANLVEGPRRDDGQSARRDDGQTPRRNDGQSDSDVRLETHFAPDWARLTAVTHLQPGERTKLTKFIGWGWSNVRSPDALRDQVAGAVTMARLGGFDQLLSEQRAYLDAFWDAADVEVEGDDEIQQAVRFGLFHVLQGGARAEGRGIAAKGLTGPGYDGHTFWDTESFVLPVLTLTMPDAAAHSLRWRYSTLELAKQRAATLGVKGAAFPWRTIHGEECSGYWPAGTAAMHVTADIANAVTRYTSVTGDDSLEVEGGLELLIETARLWMSLGNVGQDGHWHVAGVTGPDEYTALVDDNVYTNLAASQNLLGAANAAERHLNLAAQLGVAADEVDSWRAAAEAVCVPYDEKRQVHEQNRGFTTLPEWDFEANRDKYPLLLHVPYFELYRRQVIKQADLELAMCVFGEYFSDSDKARNVDYYEPRTVRDSSLSANVQAVICAEVGHLELAHAFAFEAALIDLHDMHHNTRDGLHIASLAGAWVALVFGFGGLRIVDGALHFNPQLPTDISRLCFNVRCHGSKLKVDITRGQVTYGVRCEADRDDGESAVLNFLHGDEPLALRGGETVTRPLNRVEPLLPEPKQPAGREAVRRPAHDRPDST